MSYIWIRYSDHPRIRQHVLRKHARSEVVGVARAANELSSPRAGTRDSLVPHPLPSSRRARPSLPSSLAPGSAAGIAKFNFLGRGSPPRDQSSLSRCKKHARAPSPVHNFRKNEFLLRPISQMFTQERDLFERARSFFLGIFDSSGSGMCVYIYMCV